MRLTKQLRLGNDFLVLLDPDASHPLDAAVARACATATGIGADGAIRAVPTTAGGRARVRMELYNADGSRAEMSGNGIRWPRRWPSAGRAWAVGNWWPTRPAGRPGARPARRRDPHAVRVDGAGRDRGRGARVDRRCRDPGPAGRHRQPPPGPGGRARSGRARPRAPAGDDVDLVALGEAVNAKVPGGANVHLVTPADGGIAVRTYERGVGLTRACGTGACASAAAARRWGWWATSWACSCRAGAPRCAWRRAGRRPRSGPGHLCRAVELGASPWH